MTRRRFIRLLPLLIFLMLVFVGIRYELDYCLNTASTRTSWSLWGVRFSSLTTYQDEEGYRSWLEKDIGVSWPSDYAQYIHVHPLLAANSTRPGNWMFLKGLKRAYEASPEGREEIAAFIRKVGERHRPRIFYSLGEEESKAELNEMNRLVRAYLKR